MRILFVHDFGIELGGAEVKILGLRDGLRARGHQARLFASTARPLPLTDVADYSCFGSQGGVKHVLQVVNLSAVRQLRRALAEFQPDIVHVCMFLNQLSPLILPLLRHRPAILHIANYDLICPKSSKALPDGAACHSRPGLACGRMGCLPPAGVVRVLVQQGMIARWSDRFDAIVANSDWMRRRLAVEGIPVHRTIWPGVQRRPPRRPLMHPPVVGFAGRLVPEKGVDVLLRAMARLSDHVPDVRLRIVGDGPDRARLEALAVSLGIAGTVQFLGHLPPGEAEQELGTVWVQAVPSIWEEPFGMVAAEAMMRGTAVVASRRGGLSEQIVEGETGLAVPARDDAALAEALRQLLLDRARAEALGAAARVRALSHLDEETAIERFEELYHEVTSRPIRPVHRLNS